jgi:hypothetical protein
MLRKTVVTWAEDSMDIEEQQEPSRWPSPMFISLAVSFLGAALLHAYDCDAGSTDQCLMSKGMFPAYWGGAFIVSWPVVALIAAMSRDHKARKRESFHE